MKELNKKETNKTTKSTFKDIIIYILIIFAILLFKKYVISPIRVNGESMMNTLHDGDIMIMNSINYRFSEIKRYDIVIIDEGQELIIKRVIGLPGDTVKCVNNKLYINGKRVKDKYASSKTSDFSVDVGNGEYFVLGDNRSNSMDSRVFGTFKKKEIIGKTSLTIFPFRKTELFFCIFKIYN